MVHLLVGVRPSGSGAVPPGDLAAVRPCSGSRSPSAPRAPTAPMGSRAPRSI